MKTPDLSGARWRKSSHSGANEGACIELTAVWRKSSHSGSDEGECVEIASVDRFVAVRDSKDPSGPVLPLTPIAWRGLLDRLRTER